MIAISPFVYRLFDIYEPGVCHFIDCEADLSNLSPLVDPSHPACEIVRGDTQWLGSNFLWVYCVYLSCRILTQSIFCFKSVNL